MTAFGSATRWPDLRERVRAIGVESVRPAAEDVDRRARFPAEALTALKQEKLLGALVPEPLGGRNLSLADTARTCETVAQSCAAAAMVLAMHHIQVATLVRHASEAPYFRAYLSELCKGQRLIASVTSEVGVGGDMRSSMCGLRVTGGQFELRKDATTISYGEHADDFLVTSRRAEDAAPNDQVLVLVRRTDATLERKGTWDPLGMRGTSSPGFLLTARGSTDQVVPTSFASIASETMVPVSHILWASLWLGIATDAVNRARAFVREQARKTPGTVPPTAVRVAELFSGLQTMRSLVRDATAEYEDLLASKAGVDELSSLGFALRINNLKVGASQQVVQLVHQALLICGLAGYKNDSKYALGRHLRDAHSAALMIGNDRILAANAALLLVHKEDG